MPPPWCPQGPGGTLEVVAVLGMAWRPGKLVIPPQPEGPEAHHSREVRSMAATHVKVDIPTLKARHPLGDTVEAAGVRLRGSVQGAAGHLPLPRGGGRQLHGVLRLTDGSTALAAAPVATCWTSSSAPKTFPCRRPSVGWRGSLDLVPGGPTIVRSALHHAPRPAALPPRDPTLLTAAARFYARHLKGSPEARVYLASRGIGPVAAAQLGLGYANGRGLRTDLRDPGLLQRSASGIPGSSPRDGSGALRRNDRHPRPLPPA